MVTMKDLICAQLAIQQAMELKTMAEMLELTEAETFEHIARTAMTMLAGLAGHGSEKAAHKVYIQRQRDAFFHHLPELEPTIRRLYEASFESATDLINKGKI